MNPLLTTSLFGHEKIVNRLLAAFRRGKPFHSLLLNGPESIGKKAATFSFLQHIFCDVKGDEPCGMCRSCRYFSRPWLHHPDIAVFQSVSNPIRMKVQWLIDELKIPLETLSENIEKMIQDDLLLHWVGNIGDEGNILAYLNHKILFEKSAVLPEFTTIEKRMEPLFESEPDYANTIRLFYSSIRRGSYQSSFKVDAVRQAIIEKIGMKPFLSQQRVFIIDDAENLTPGAQNALLKTLEEPPGSSMIILITAKREHVLPTVQSRCQKIVFQPPQPAEYVRIITEILHCSEEEAGIRIGISQGNIDKALLLKMEDVLRKKEKIIRILRNFKKYDFVDLAVDTDFLKQGLSQRDDTEFSGVSVMELFEQVIRETLHTRARHLMKDHYFLLSKKERNTLARYYTLEELMYLTDKVQNIHRQMDTNANPLWLIERFIIDCGRSLTAQ